MTSPTNRTSYFLGVIDKSSYKAYGLLSSSDYSEKNRFFLLGKVIDTNIEFCSHQSETSSSGYYDKMIVYLTSTGLRVEKTTTIGSNSTARPVYVYYKEWKM